MKINIDEPTNPLVEFLLTLQSVRDEVKGALEELQESGKALRKDKKAKLNVEAWKSACGVLTTAHEELAEVCATVLSSAPESVQEEVGGGEDIDTSPEGIQKLQAQMLAYLEGLGAGTSPPHMASQAACTAAEVMFRMQLAMAMQTYEATVAAAEQARNATFQASALVYQDTCMQALETCGALKNGRGKQEKRTLQ